MLRILLKERHKRLWHMETAAVIGKGLARAKAWRFFSGVWEGQHKINASIRSSLLVGNFQLLSRENVLKQIAFVVLSSVSRIPRAVTWWLVHLEPRRKVGRYHGISWWKINLWSDVESYGCIPFHGYRVKCIVLTWGMQILNCCFQI